MNKSNDAKPQWSIRQYHEGDKEQILELRATTLGDSRNDQWWNWIYENGPDGPSSVWLAVTEQKVVGLNTRLPLRMKIGDQVYKVALSYDIMTHPDYQRQGILGELAKKGTGYAEKIGISCTYGIAMNRIMPIYKGLKMGYDHIEICELPLLVKIISLGKVLKRSFGIPAFIGNPLGYAWESITMRKSSTQNNDIEIEQVSSFDESIDEFWLKASELKKIMIVKDMKYLNWRYVEKPGDEYIIFLAKRQEEIIGYIVFKSKSDPMTRGFIVDILTLPGEDIVAELLISKAIEYFQGEGALTISCVMLQDTSYYRTLRKLGFMHRHSSLWLGIRLHDPNLSGESLADPGNWYFVWGDNDTM